MKISFILPCYNVEGYVTRCVESIIKMQEQDIEIIAVNDGSKDNTLAVLLELEEKYGITVISFDNPSGYAGRPRNAGLEVAKGEFIAFMDPDDYYLGNEIITAYNKYKKYDVIINSFDICDPSGQVTDRIRLKDKDIDRCKFLWRQIVNVCNQRTLFKKSFIDKHNIKFYEDCRSQDLLFLYTAYVEGAKLRTSSLVTTMYLDEREDSVSNVISKKYIETSIIAYERFFNLINNSLCSKEVDSAIGEHFLGYYLKVRKQLNDEQKEMLRSTNFYNHIKHNIVKVK